LPDCTNVTELIPLFMDNELSDEERGCVEGHLSSCKECMAHYDELRALMVSLYSIEDEELPEGFHKEFMEKLKNHPKHKPVFMTWNYKAITLTAACAAAVLIAVSTLSVGISELLNFGRPAVYSAQETIQADDTAHMEIKAAGDAGEFYNSRIYEDGFALSPPAAVDSISVDAGFSVAGSAADPIKSSITHYYIELTVEDIKGAMDQISRLSGTQVSMNYSMPAYEGDHGSAAITRRVSAQEFEIMKDQLRSIGDVNNESESKESMTRQLRDLKARLEAKDAEKARLLKLLGMSGDLDVMIRIESRLNSVSEESESLNSQIRSIDYEIGRPFLNIQLYNRVYAPPALPKQGLGIRMANSFKQSVNDTVSFMQGLLLFVVSAAIPVTVFIICVILLFMLYKFIAKRRRGRRKQ